MGSAASSQSLGVSTPGWPAGKVHSQRTSGAADRDPQLLWTRLLLAWRRAEQGEQRLSSFVEGALPRQAGQRPSHHAQAVERMEVTEDATFCAHALSCSGHSRELEWQCAGRSSIEGNVGLAPSLTLDRLCFLPPPPGL